MKPATRTTSGGLWIPAAQEAARLLRRQRGMLGVAAAALVANRIASLAIPLAVKLAVDDLTHRGPITMTAALTLATAAVAVQSVSGLALMRLVGLVAGRTMAAIRRDLHDRAIRLPLASLERIAPGAIVSRGTTDAEQVGAVLILALVPLASSVLTAGGALAMLGSVSRSLAFGAAATMIGAAVVLSRAFSRFAEAFAQLGTANAGLAGRLTTTIGALSLVKTQGAERHESHAFARAVHRHLRAFAQTTHAAAVLATASSMATGIAGVLLLAAGTHAVRSGTWTLGDLTLVALLVGLLVSPIVQVAALTRELGETAAILAWIHWFRAIETEEEEDRWRLRLRRPTLDGQVRVERVRYAYPSGRVALRDVTFTAEPGSMTALVGVSGSGKSTICRLLADLDRPTRGRIMVDGVDLATVRRRDYRRHVGVVLQDHPLLSASIADNIRYGRSGVSAAVLHDAARRARCHEFVEQLPDGYDTVVSEHGLALSAGERQRIALARVILTDSRIILLDEITAHLDAATEADIVAAIGRLRGDRTIVVVAHRLPTIRDADQIIVLDQGAVVECGSHAALMARRGCYYRLWAGQSSSGPPAALIDATAWVDKPPQSSWWTRDVDWELMA